MSLHASMELRQVLAEAEDIAAQVSQRLTSAHLLLALFTVANRAEILLKEKQIDEDSILAQVHTVGEEAEGTVKQVHNKARQIAAGASAEAIDCLHLLVALCGMRQTVAYDLLRLTGLPMTQFRNTALSYVTNPLPRRLTIKKKSAGVAPSVGEHSRIGPAIIQPWPARVSAPPAVIDREVDDDNEWAEVGPDRKIEKEDANPVSEWDLQPTRFPLLSKLGRNLTALAALGKLDPLVGRAKELDEVIDTLLKRRSNNPLLVGEPGVGKTAIVEGLALRIVEGSKDTRALAERRIIELDVATLLAGTQLRGAFSEKLKQIREEVAKAEGQIVIFFDEIHTLMGAGSTGDGPQDAANELKSSLARGEFPCIGATTYDEYRRFVEQDAALSRRFQLIQIPEPDPEATLAILTGITAEYAEHHTVRYTPEALQAAVHLSSRYITDRCLPDKAIGLLDLAGSRARRSGRKVVDREAVARVVSSVAQVPVERLLMTDAERLLNMEKILGLQIIGHTGVIRSMANVIRRNYAGFAHKRPIGSFLFLGPTGVGKTETARALAQFLFNSRDTLVKLDMSEYIESHTISRLIGSPPGYVGHHEGGQLTEAVRRKPYTLVLFDEIEKAHPEVQQLLLQILDEGRLTDGRGRTVDFTNTIIILTSNQGTANLGRPGPARIGFGGAVDANPGREVIQSARNAFPPELWGRLDEHLFFRPLGTDDLVSIAWLLVKESSARLRQERRMRLAADREVMEYLVSEGCPDTSLGARPMRAAVRRLIEQPLSEAILSNKFAEGQRIRVSLTGEGLRFDTDTGEGNSLPPP